VVWFRNVTTGRELAIHNYVTFCIITCLVIYFNVCLYCALETCQLDFRGNTLIAIEKTYNTLSNTEKFELSY
jgi:hypothetical protein